METLSSFYAKQQYFADEGSHQTEVKSIFGKEIKWCQNKQKVFITLFIYCHQFWTVWYSLILNKSILHFLCLKEGPKGVHWMQVNNLLHDCVTFFMEPTCVTCVTHCVSCVIWEQEVCHQLFEKRRVLAIIKKKQSRFLSLSNVMVDVYGNV